MHDFLRNINQSFLKDAKMYIWNLPAGVRIRESIKEARGTFIKSLYTATDQLQTTAAANLLIKEIDTWIMELRTYAIKVRTSPRSRKATELMVKHRAANLTYRSTLTRFGHNPSMETMVSVRAALKELYVLKILILCDLIIDYCVEFKYYHIFLHFKMWDQF